MGDIEKICKRAIIIQHGDVVVDESMKTLKHRAMAKNYVGVRYEQAVSFYGLDTGADGIVPVLWLIALAYTALSYGFFGLGLKRYESGNRMDVRI